MLKIRLFGEFLLHTSGADLLPLRSGKLAELFCYLLIQRGRAHSREMLGSVLWSDSSTAQSKKYLRQSLWQLQRLLRESAGRSLLVLDRDSVRVCLEGDVRLDLAEFEDACHPLQNVPAAELTDVQAQCLKDAVALYQGALLEGWFQDWCLLERERMESLYLLTLEKLLLRCEQRKEIEDGLQIGERILRVDRAHEVTHRALMRIHACAGDRSGAIRQFQRCEAALHEEFSVPPAPATMELLRQVRGECRLQTTREREALPERSLLAQTAAMDGLLARLRAAVALLNQTHAELEQEVAAIGRMKLQPYPKALQKQPTPR